MVWGHTLGIEGQPSFTYLEGCFHLLTPFLASTRQYSDSMFQDHKEYATTAAEMGISASNHTNNLPPLPIGLGGH